MLKKPLKLSLLIQINSLLALVSINIITPAHPVLLVLLQVATHFQRQIQVDSNIQMTTGSMQLTDLGASAAQVGLLFKTSLTFALRVEIGFCEGPTHQSIVLLNLQLAASVEQHVLTPPQATATPWEELRKTQAQLVLRSPVGKALALVV